ncbi:nitrilase family protein [Arcticibacterium luteifluviistationis]|uniref:Omega-amidase YafV n=1 Tax=Arcticibacterium luteifluviistationis TaxID=1784714 RepID=A0A2Z4GF29_9BACT|nr:nitrilase family protein [Arcticibacterium luteifluviistationis]AWV99830.1 nitrilase family protein [Arcticibacterium luteifluviistationis]
MENDLRVAVIQPDTYWENPEANRSELEEIISSLASTVDLITLPEMFSTGFSTNPEKIAEPMNFTTHKWMKQMATRYNAAICGSLVIKEGQNFFNRLLFVKPDGETSFYDKRHLFAYGGEDALYTKGIKKVIINYKDWKICPLICYDLRFPVFARNNKLEYDILLYSANWPAKRENVWETLLKARAIENQSYVIGINRVGVDANKLEYNGHSAIIDPKGYELKKLGNKNEVGITTLSKKGLTDFRESFPAHLDSDDFEVL